MMKELYSALLIPFDEKGQVIESGLREVIRHNIDENKVDGLYVNGSSGENFLLSTDQKKQIFKITAEETNKEAKLIAQVGALNLDEAIELGQYATELGYDSLSAVTPFYYKFNFEDKVDGLYVNGSSGENFLLSTEQKKQIFKITAEETNKEAKLIAQVGALNLVEAIELGQYATELGYDSLSAVTPFYYKFNFEE